MEKAKRMAVLVGCNYRNTKNELHGCINDVLAMKQVLVDRFGFANIRVLTDDDHQDPDRLTLPTGSNIKRALHEMVDAAEEGDVLFFHYSGHGTRIPSLNPAHVLRQDEAIVPCDFNLITDADFRQLVNKLPKGATFTMLSDSCHSGGLIDKEKEQIGPSTVLLAPKSLDTVSIALKTIPFQAILKDLASLTNIHTSDVGTHLLELFGSEASLVFKQHPVSSLSEDNDDEGILLSGCQANETSADINPASSTMASGGEKAYGAFSNAIQKVLKENQGTLSNKEVVVRVREVLKKQGFVNQHPCLYCSDENAGAAFLSQ
ncbi:AMC9 [Linum grandiflorum]